MAAAPLGVRLGSSAHLADSDDQRFVQHAASLQIGQQGGDRAGPEDLAEHARGPEQAPGARIERLDALERHLDVLSPRHSGLQLEPQPRVAAVLAHGLEADGEQQVGCDGLGHAGKVEPLAQVGLGDSAERVVAETSYGERRRLELAMALAQRPKVLLLDEPLAGLSQGERQTVRVLLGAIPRDVTIVMIEHDMDTALGFAERITVLHYGEVIVEGTRAEVVADPRTREVYLGD